jgi:hypothetical protein
VTFELLDLAVLRRREHVAFARDRGGLVAALKPARILSAALPGRLAFAVWLQKTYTTPTAEGAFGAAGRGSMPQAQGAGTGVRVPPVLLAPSAMHARQARSCRAS